MVDTQNVFELCIRHNNNINNWKCISRAIARILKMSVSSDGGGIQCPAQQAGNKGDSTQITCLDSDGVQLHRLYQRQKLQRTKYPIGMPKSLPNAPFR